MDLLNTKPDEKGSVVQHLSDPLFVEKKVDVSIKREDLIHPLISGNKWRKLKYNLEKAKSKGLDTILTFGGAHSNHIHATAAASAIFGVKSIGVIRGEEHTENETLQEVKAFGMRLKFISRSDYREKNERYFIQKLHDEFGPFHLVPEGGANYHGVNGCIEIMQGIEDDYDYVILGVGTGCTTAGLMISSQNKYKVLGFPALKGGGFLKNEIQALLNNFTMSEEYTLELMTSLELITDYHFGGFGKVKPELIDFMKGFFKKQEK